MTTFIIRRILIAIFVIFCVSVFSFSLLHMMPGDPARLALGAEASEEDVQALREEMNLDKPILTQYLLWVDGVFHWEFGRSIIYKMTINELMSIRLPRTFSIGAPAFCIAIPCGLVLGVACAVFRGKMFDKIATFCSTIIMGMPAFWLSILICFTFAVWLKILPLQGYKAPSEGFGLYVSHAIGPVLAMSLGMITGTSRNTRTYLLNSLNEDFVRTARANGLPERSVIFKHALKNALIPIITVMGMQVRVLIGGSILVERVFNIPGIGTLMSSSVSSRDYLVVMANTLMISLFTVVANLIVDILYGVVDPRIRLSRG